MEPIRFDGFKRKSCTYCGGTVYVADNDRLFCSRCRTIMPLRYTPWEIGRCFIMISVGIAIAIFSMLPAIFGALL